MQSSAMSETDEILDTGSTKESNPIHRFIDRKLECLLIVHRDGW